MERQAREEGEGRQVHDATILREQAYADDTHLDVRYRTHRLYTVDPVDFGQWTLERVPWRGDERVLDIGCGPGGLLRQMAFRGGWRGLVGFDFSSGMAAEAASSASGLPVRFLVSDAQSMPFPDDSFDVAMARHMLYHVPDIDRAVSEVARVLRPGGHLLATTNGADTMAEARAIRAKAAVRCPALINPERVTDRFSLENAPVYLEPHFEQIETHTLPGILRFPIVQPFVDYFASGRALLMHPGHTDAEWLEVLALVRSEAEAIIARQGHLDVTKITGAIVGIKGG